MNVINLGNRTINREINLNHQQEQLRTFAKTTGISSRFTARATRRHSYSKAFERESH